MLLPLRESQLTSLEQILQHVGLGLGFIDVFLLVRRDIDIRQGYRHAGNGGILESQILDRIQDIRRTFGLVACEHFCDDLRQTLLREFRGYLLFLDEPTLEEDGVFRSPNGVWSNLKDFRWMLNIEKGKYKKYKLVEDEIPVTDNQ